MKTIKNILFPTDYSACSDAAYPQAVFLARQYEAHLHLLHIDTLGAALPEEEDPAIFDSELLTIRRKDVVYESEEVILKNEVRNRVPVSEIEMSSISAHEGILDYAERHNIDLIVLASHGKHGVERFLLGSTAEKVTRHATCPVLSIRCRESKEPSLPEQIGSILVPVDFSDSSQLALRWAKNWAAMYDARIDLLHVIDALAIPPVYKTGGYIDHNIDIDLEQEIKQQLRDLDSVTKGPVRASRFDVSSGNTASEIIDYANRYSDMVILTSHGLTGLKHFLMGSVAEKITRRVRRPVLVLKSLKNPNSTIN